MAGIYVHIPFCASRCLYCDFFSTTQLHRRETYVNALCHEIEQRRTEIEGKEDTLSTLYLGGGTPSQLSFPQLQRIFDTLSTHYPFADDAEITIEVNPEDVDEAFVEGLSLLVLTTASGRPHHVTRVSMGVQTFNDDVLRFLHRRHTADKALKAIELMSTQYSVLSTWSLQLSIDLIFGLPALHSILHPSTDSGQTCKSSLLSFHSFLHDLSIVKDLPIHHLSAYSLMYEEGTPLSILRANGRVREVGEEESLEMYKTLIATTEAMGMEHYEISNFARPGCRSRHNSSYWTGAPYLGFGAGAHSYDGLATRRENLPSIEAYMKGEDYSRLEHLSQQDLYNERVMCSLRTREGINLQRLEKDFGASSLTYCLQQAQKYLEKALLLQKSHRLFFSPSGVFVSDDIMSDLMCV